MIQKLLVVGASSIVEQLFKIALMDSSIEVATTHSHREAENIIVTGFPDVVFIDPALKDKDPFEFAKSVKEVHHRPVVILKSSTDSWDDEVFAKSRADGVLKKPFDPATLMSILNRFNGKKEVHTPQKKTGPEVEIRRAMEKQPTSPTSPRSAISLLKRAELENAKKFIQTNLVKKSKTPIVKASKSSLRNMLEKESICISDETLEAKVNEIAREVIERVAWEVVPGLAEKIILQELKRLTED